MVARHDYALDSIEARARRDSVPAAHHLLQLSGCLSLRAQAVRRSDLQLSLEGLDQSLYHCESTGCDLSTDAVAAACGMLAVAADEIAQAERGDHTCQREGCGRGVACETAAQHEFCERGDHVCTSCEARQ